MLPLQRRALHADGSSTLPTRLLAHRLRTQPGRRRRLSARPTCRGDAPCGCSARRSGSAQGRDTRARPRGRPFACRQTSLCLFKFAHRVWSACHREALAQVEAAEVALHALGFTQLRVRHHGELARIELTRDELPRALSLEIFDRISLEL